MSKGVKTAIILIVVVVVLVILGFIIAKYTTVGMSLRINRLHDQVERRYSELNETYEIGEAKSRLEVELNENRLVDSAAFDGDKLVLCYIDGTCEDYYVGIED